MKPNFLIGSLAFGKWGIVVLTVGVALLIALSGIFYPSTLIPLYILGAVIAALIGYVLLMNPVWSLYIALFIALLPMGTIPENLQSLLNRAIAVIAMGTWLFDVIFKRRKISFTASALFMLIFLAWANLTMFWAENFSAGLTRLQVYLLRFLVFLILIPNEIKSRKQLDGLLDVMSLSGWVLIVSSLIAMLNNGYMPGSRFKLFDANENSLGVLALLAMSAVLIRSSHPSKNKSLRTFIAALFVLLTIGLVAVSGSRGGSISVIIALAAFWLWKSSRPWGKFGFAILILGFIVTPFVFKTTIDRFVQVSGGSVLGGREILWQAAWQLITQHPLGGVGIGNAPYSIVPYVTLLASTSGKDSVSLHNPVLLVWSETGFLGIGLYLAVLTSALVSFIKHWLKYGKRVAQYLTPYFAFVASLFLGYMASWIKGGGMEADFTYFLMLALLLIPSGLNVEADRDEDRALTQK
ncbi:MAG TPA: O-antigen ligase family protein [Anaerolineales bacterium]|nr:O-antigen ligase family protein [Anaerolineales bacterium]HLO28421.1 O-antigen ligase family protein [Anaerolineales bacterium]